MFSALAFVCVFNEADILPWTLAHLVDQGVGVYVIDNWSTDGSDAIAQRFPLAGFERFPDAPVERFECARLIDHVADLAAASDASWCMLYDADEIRRSPVPGETLAAGIERIDRHGCNAIDHVVYTFAPTDDSYAGDPEKHFRYYRMPEGKPLPQIKCWKNTGRKVENAKHGGHIAEFPDMRVSSQKFVLKHYPLRTKAQAERKVLRERLARYPAAERALGWHVQYDAIARTRQWITPQSALKEWV